MLLCSFALTLLKHRAALVRAMVSIKDLGISIAYYFCQIFNVDMPVTVTELPDAAILVYLPFDVDEILRKLRDMWGVIFDGECFNAYFTNIVVALNDFSMIFLLTFPLFFMLPLLFNKLFLKENDAEHGDKSRSVVFVEKKLIPLWFKIKDFFKSILSVLFGKKVYKWIFVILWLINFNLLTLICEFLAYYFYFPFSIDVGNLLTIQVVKLMLDIIIMLSSAPVLFWIIVVYIIICKIRRNIGYTRLDFRENLDRAFKKTLSVLVMFTGTIGTGKTTAVTSFGLSDEIEFRRVAFEMMMDIDCRYPNFAWILLEDELRCAIVHGHIKNLTQCRKFIRKKQRRFLKEPCSVKIFGYEFETYRYSLNDNLTYSDVWHDIEDYACLYFIYIIESSLILANYSVRSDNVLNYIGNFPLWDTELFRNSPESSAERTRRAHILDFDVLRLGRKLMQDNPKSGTFEFGVVLLSEFAKERGNKITNEGIKKTDDSTNQKNDLLAYSMKVARHKATVRGYPFIRFIADEQRPTSLEADTRELMSIVHIDKKHPTELLMPMFFVEELIHDIIYPKFVQFYSKYRFYRSDTCLAVYILHNGVSALHNYYKKTYNLFGCNVLDVTVQDGRMESAGDSARIHLLHKKVYSDRFATDCYNGFFAPELEQAEISFDEYEEYAETVANRDELHSQHSYFVKDLENISVNKESEKNEK